MTRLLNKETQVGGEIMTFRDFIGSLPIGEFMVQDRQSEKEMEYFPVEALLSGIAPGLDEWNIQYVVFWWSADVAVICRPYPGAAGKTFVRKSHLQSKGILPGRIVVLADGKTLVTQ